MKTTRHFLFFIMLIVPIEKGLCSMLDVADFVTSTLSNLRASMPLTGERGFLNAAANSVASTTVSSLLQPSLKKKFFDPKIYIHKGVGKFRKGKIKGVYYNTQLQSEIERYIEILKALEPDDIKPHFVFRGPPGTGKTLLAKRIAQRTGFQYEFISGASIMQFSEAEAVREISELFDRIDKPAKKRSDVTVVIFDESQDFLMENFRQNRFLMQNVNNFMFTRAGEPSANYFFIFTYNSLFPIDERWIRRIDHHLQFDLPDVDTRYKLWSYYLKKSVKKAIKQKGSEEELNDFIDNIEIVSADLAGDSHGFTGSNISQVCKTLERRMKTAKPWRTFDMEVALKEIATTRRKYQIPEVDFNKQRELMIQQEKKSQNLPN